MAILEQSPNRALENRLSLLPEGVRGIRETLRAMAKAAREAQTVLSVRDLAQSIIRRVPPKDYAGELTAIQEWIRSNIRYTRDPVEAEMLKTPSYLIESKFGDCDDMATLAAALVMSIGFPARFVAIGVNKAGVFEHVFTEALLGTVWLSLETTESVRLGWVPHNIKARLLWHL